MERRRCHIAFVMSTSETGAFRLRQTIADLNRQRLAFPLATIRRIGAGIGVRSTGAPDLQRRLEWYFSGKAPVGQLRRDRLVHGALLMVSALPEDDFECFLASTTLLLLERLISENGKDDGFWNWRRLAPHYRLAPAPQRAAIMCGFREARRMGRISPTGGPTPEDCLSAPRTAVLAALAGEENSVLSAVRQAVQTEADARSAGELWATQHRAVALLPDGPRQAAEAGFRYLYERPVSMDIASGADVPSIPVHD
jgi:hypothetical protein